jgi:predicted TIM-barrel fold metal-dependent hydrolase
MPPRESITGGSFISTLSAPAGTGTEAGLAAVRAQVLGESVDSAAVLNCYYGIESIRNPDLASALASAVNDWLAERWLARDSRFRASIVVPAQLPEVAAKEIDRIAAVHSQFVQVLLPVRSERPYGQRFYYPIYDAAVRHNLAIGIHFGGYTGNAPTASGWPTYYFEEYVGMSTAFQVQVSSLVLEGALQEYPDLRIGLLESGWTWLPSLMWRLDKEWHGLRRETPWVQKLPSDYIRKQIRLSLQPIDIPLDRDLVLRAIDQLGGPELLMFSTDYPHQHGVNSADFMALLPAKMAATISVDSPRQMYGL